MAIYVPQTDANSAQRMQEMQKEIDNPLLQQTGGDCLVRILERPTRRKRRTTPQPREMQFE